MNRTRTVAKKITYFIFSTLLLVMLILPQIRITESSAVSSKTITISQNAQSITWGGFSKTSLPTFTYSSTSIFDKSLTTFNGNDTFTFKIKANTSTSQRTGYIYAKNSSGTIIATLTVKQAAHTHSYTSWKVTAIPTCTTPGSQYSICSCGNKRTAIIYPTGHRCRITKSTAATCAKKGTVTNECFKCSFTTTVTIPATGKHTDVLYYNSSNTKLTIHCSVCKRVNNTDVSFNDYLDFLGKTNITGDEKYDLFDKYLTELRISEYSRPYAIDALKNYDKYYSKFETFINNHQELLDECSQLGDFSETICEDKMTQFAACCGYINIACDVYGFATSTSEPIKIQEYISALAKITGLIPGANVTISKALEEFPEYAASVVETCLNTNNNKYLCYLYEQDSDHGYKYGKYTLYDMLKDDTIKNQMANLDGGWKTIFIKDAHYTALLHAKIAFSINCPINDPKLLNDPDKMAELFWNYALTEYQLYSEET